jgi:hypothetical protein
MLSPPSAYEIRPFGNGRVSVQVGKEIGVVDWALNAAPLWKLKKRVKPISMYAQLAVRQKQH